MSDALSASSRSLLRPLLIAGGVAGALIGVAIVFWLRYGTSVFYEMLLSGIAACF